MGLDDNINNCYEKYFKEPQHDYLSYLLEHTFDIDKDVELLYKKSNFKVFTDFFNKFKSNILSVLPNNFSEKEVILFKSDSSILKSDDAKKAHNINPIDIEIGIFPEGSFYQPKKHKIQISLNYRALKLLIQYEKYGIVVIERLLKKSEFRIFIGEFSKDALKARIVHELAHWISDSLHNKHLTTLIDLSKDLDKSLIDILKIKHVDMSYFEIDAQIHAIKQVKNNLKTKYDKIDLTDLFFEYPALRKVFVDIYSKYRKEISEIWLKYLIKRMSRENLLGKNMKQFPDIEKLTESLYRI